MLAGNHSRMMACAAMLAALAVPLPSIAQTEKDAATVVKDIDAAVLALSKVKLKDPAALDAGKAKGLVDSLLELLRQKDGSSIELQRLKLSKDLLGTYLTTPAKWPEPFAIEVREQATAFDNASAAYDTTLEFVRAGTLVASRIKNVTATHNGAIATANTLALEIDNRFPSGPAPSAKDEVNTWARSLTGKVKDTAVREVLLSDATTVAALDTLRQELARFSTRNQSRVHIVGALYGDLNTIRRVIENGRVVDGTHARLCIATAVAAESCERKPECKIAIADYRKGLCGYDPAPFLDTRYMALMIWYACRSNTNEANWNGVPGRVTGVFDPAVNARGQGAVLYSQSQSFSCKDVE